MSDRPVVFISSVNLDGHYEQGWLIRFREHLNRAVQRRFDKPFEIFLDRKDTAWQRQWQECVSASLNAAAFLIPVITPGFFLHRICRNELEQFLKRERKLERKDLILPLYYASSLFLNDPARRERDDLAWAIAAHRYADWRELRSQPFDSEQVKEALAQLAGRIVAVLKQSESRRQYSDIALPMDTVLEAFTLQPTGEDSTGHLPRKSTSSAGKRKQGIPQQDTPDAEKKSSLSQRAKTGLWRLLNIARSQRRPDRQTPTRTVVVDPLHRGDYTTINAALHAVQPGTRILVRPGRYQEEIEIYKPIEIVGEGKRGAVVIEAFDEHTIRFRTEMGRLANLTLRQLGSDDWCALDISHGWLDVEQCDISGQGNVCVAIYGGADPRLYRNRIHGAKMSGIIIHSKGQGTLEDNKISDNPGYGIMITADGNPTMRHNRILHNGAAGVCVHGSGGGIFERNDLRGNAEGAWEILPSCEAGVHRTGNLE